LSAPTRGILELLNWKLTLFPVIPAEAGIQAVFERKLKRNLDAGFHRHDGKTE
jgi:hypothetical protein